MDDSTFANPNDNKQQCFRQFLRCLNLVSQQHPKFCFSPHPNKYRQCTQVVVKSLRDSIFVRWVVKKNFLNSVKWHKFADVGENTRQFLRFQTSKNQVNKTILIRGNCCLCYVVCESASLKSTVTWIGVLRNLFCEMLRARCARAQYGQTQSWAIK